MRSSHEHRESRGVAARLVARQARRDAPALRCRRRGADHEAQIPGVSGADSPASSEKSKTMTCERDFRLVMRDPAIRTPEIDAWLQECEDTMQPLVDRALALMYLDLG